MRLGIPKSLLIELVNNNDGTATAHYSEVVVWKKEVEAKKAVAGTRLLYKTLKEKVPITGATHISIKRKGKKVYTVLDMNGPIELIVPSLINELEIQITPIKEVKKEVTSHVRKIVGEDGLKEIREEAKKIRDKYEE